MAGPDAVAKANGAATVLLWLTAAFGSAALVIVFGGAFSPRLDALTGAVPVLLAIGLAIAAAAALTRRLFAAGAATLATLPLLWLVGADLLAPARWPADRPGPTLKIIALNVLSYNWTPDAVERLVASEHPDILLLQEASSYAGRRLADRLALQYPTQIANYPHCSTRIFSKLPVRERQPRDTCSITTALLKLPEMLGGGDVLIATVHAPRGQTQIEQSEVSTLATLMQKDGAVSAIFGGDFNATPWSWSLRRFDAIEGVRRRTHALATWPTDRVVPWRLRRLRRFVAPILAIDHVYASSDWATVAVRRGPNVGSDHYPVIVELARRVPEQ
jgi:endonuclease/exonuclease/phosphatase (EEP) superfamily protein YafD